MYSSLGLSLAMDDLLLATVFVSFPLVSLNVAVVKEHDPPFCNNSLEYGNL